MVAWALSDNNLEIERKFLLTEETYNLIKNSYEIYSTIAIKRYYYLNNLKADRSTVRFSQYSFKGNTTAKLNFKTATNDPAVRVEHEVSVPVEILETLNLKDFSVIEKIREVYLFDLRSINSTPILLEVDIFKNGLKILEVELPDKSITLDLVNPIFQQEITDKPEYSNYNLSKNPNYAR